MIENACNRNIMEQTTFQLFPIHFLGPTWYISCPGSAPPFDAAAACSRSAQPRSTNSQKPTVFHLKPQNPQPLKPVFMALAHVEVSEHCSCGLQLNMSENGMETCECITPESGARLTTVCGSDLLRISLAPQVLFVMKQQSCLFYGNPT